MKKVHLIIAIFLFILSSLNAQTPSARTWYYNKYGEKTTIKERWNEDAQGLKHGTYIKYFEDGKREILGNYNHDKAHGIWEITRYTNSIFEQSKSICYTSFNNGLQHGSYKIVVNDIITVEGNYSNDMKTGYWKDDYNTTDKVYGEGNYVNDKRNGEWKNTFQGIKSKDDLAMGFILGGGDLNSIQLETKKGYRTIYNHGEVVAVYDENGQDVLKKQEAEFKKNQEEKLQEKERQKLEEDNYLNPLIAKWNSLTDTNIVFVYHNRNLSFPFFDEYYKKFPRGYRQGEVGKMLESSKRKISDFMNSIQSKYENNKNELLIIPPKDNHIYKPTDNINVYEELFQKYPKGVLTDWDKWIYEKVKTNIHQYKNQVDYLISVNTDQSLKLAMSILNVIGRYNLSLHNSMVLSLSIQRALINWRLGNIDATLNEVEIHKDDVINFSNGSQRYSKEFREYYKNFRISYPNEKEVWKKISDILNL